MECFQCVREYIQLAPVQQDMLCMNCGFRRTWQVGFFLSIQSIGQFYSRSMSFVVCIFIVHTADTNCFALQQLPRQMHGSATSSFCMFIYQSGLQPVIIASFSMDYMRPRANGCRGVATVLSYCIVCRASLKRHDE